MQDVTRSVATETTLDSSHVDSHGGGQGNRLDIKITPPGVITAEPHGDGWWLISIGRRRGPKRFNLTRNEAAQLVDVLTRDVLTQDGPE